jgi:hypothetical protein
MNLLRKEPLNEDDKKKMDKVESMAKALVITQLKKNILSKK